MSNILVIAEHVEGSLRKTTLHTITAAKNLSQLEGGEVHVLVIGGGGAPSVAKEVSRYGVSRVLVASSDVLENYLAEAWAPVAASIISEGGYAFALAPASTFGKDLMPRIAGLLDAPMASDIIGFEKEGENLLIKRPMYAGNAIATVVLEGTPKLITVRQTAFDAAGEEGEAPIEEVSPQVDASSLKSRYVKMEATKSERPELTEARVVVSAGRGIKAKENFALIEELADLLGAAIGASRAAVDAGWAPNDWQVGQTGKIVAPELYIAVGISGAIQHLAGMKDSKVIVAINKDEEAPIFQVADYGLVADLFKAVPELIEELKKAKEAS